VCVCVCVCVCRVSYDGGVLFVCFLGVCAPCVSVVLACFRRKESLGSISLRFWKGTLGRSVRACRGRGCPPPRGGAGHVRAAFRVSLDCRHALRRWRQERGRFLFFFTVFLAKTLNVGAPSPLEVGSKSFVKRIASRK